MNIDQEIEKLHTAYAAKFGDIPDFDWIEHTNGDGPAYAELLKKALETGIPLGDYDKAMGIKIGPEIDL